MRDQQEVIEKFVKIIQRYPELYDPGNEMYRSRFTERTWENIVDCVKEELNEECTVEELRMKWKGIRSSFNRCRNKLTRPNGTIAGPACKKYYLYDSLSFLLPFSRSKVYINDEYFNPNWTNSCIYSDDDDSSREHDPTNTDVKVKSEPEDEDQEENIVNPDDVIGITFDETHQNKKEERRAEEKKANLISDNKDRKRKYEDADDETNLEDLIFFKSILPDIKDFSIKEKRKLKMGILKLIDEIEDIREHEKGSREVTSSKLKRQG